MSKRKLQKVLGLILSAAMVVGLAACGSEETKGTTAGSETQKESVVESTTPAETSEKEPEVVVSTYPLDTDVTLRFWCASAMKYQSAFNSADESPFHSGLEKNTGVDIEWEFPQDGVHPSQAFSLLMTENELPHMIYYWPTPAEGEEYIQDGLIWDLTDYLPVYAPDYWEHINSDEVVSLRRAVTTESGKHYMIAGSVESDFCITYRGFALRKDWLDECGLDIPVTLEDWEKVLITFKEKYNATFSSPKIGYAMASGTGAYADNKATWYVEDGKVNLANITDEYKEYLQILNKWTEMGLIDPDIATNDNASIRNKCVNNEVGAMYIGSGTLRNILADAETSGNGAEWIGVQHPVTEEGESVTYFQTRPSLGHDNGAFITKECSEEELIVALQFLNYAFTEEGFMYWNFGNEGESYTLDADGKPMWTELITESEVGANTAYTYYIGTSASGPAIQAEALIELLNPGVAGEALRQWTSNVDSAKKHLMPKVSLTAEENLVYTDAWAAIQTYVSESFAAFISGDKSFDEWDNYVADLEKIGLSECREVQQDAYDRWLTK